MLQTSETPRVADHKPERCLLVVEDEPLIRMLAVDLLGDIGFKAEEAGSASEAMIKLRTQAFDAIILDVGLPDRLGTDLAAEIRGIWPNVPMLIASGRSASELSAQFAADALVRIVAKPYTVADLRSALEAVRVLPFAS